MPKDLPLRRFTTVAEYLAVPTTITRDGVPIGQFLPQAWLDKVQPVSAPTLEYSGEIVAQKEIHVDEQVKKAIEPDKPRVVETSKGPKVVKGLGDVPGVTSGFGQSRPAPKPKK